MFLSGICLVHCLALPMVLAIAPWIVPGLLRGESFHLWAVGLALPVSAAGIGWGLRRHGSRYVLVPATAGLLSMAAGALLAPAERSEVLLTVAGASSLALAHLWNWRLRESGPVS
jgi:hypothetical protein